MSFRDYIATRRVTDTPAGDFVREARKDRHLPVPPRHWRPSWKRCKPCEACN